jgi:hypothetical protein
LRQLLKLVLLLLVGLELLYVIAANVFLNFKLLPLAFKSTNQVQATVSGGWTIIPARVHVRDVRFTFQDHNLQFVINVDRAFLVLHLSELLHHTFHASHLRGEGLSFRMRHRVDPWSKHEPSVGAFAPIPEFPGPPVFEAYVPEPPIPDATYNLWTIHLDDVDVGVKEAWVQDFRYQGRGRARGLFALKPARHLWVGPASLDLEPGLLSAGAYRVAPGLHGHIDCVVHPFDVRVPQGMAVFRYISARIQLDSPELDPQVAAWFTGEAGPKISSAGGSLHLDVATSHGVLSEHSQLELRQNGLELRTPALEVDAERVLLSAGLDGSADSEATLTVDRALIREPIALGYPPLVEHLSASVVADNRDTALDFRFKEARLGEARLALGDARWLNRWLKSKGLEIRSGGALLQARGRYADSRLDAEAGLQTDGLVAALGAKRVRYAGSLALKVNRADPEKMTGSVDADLTGRALNAELGEQRFDVAGLRAHVFLNSDARGRTARGHATLSALSSRGGAFTASAPALTATVDYAEQPDGREVSHFDVDIPALTAEGGGARLTSAALARGTFAQSKKNSEKSLKIAATLLRTEARFGAQPVKTASTPRVLLNAELSTDASGALNGALALLPAAWRIDAANMRFSGRSALALELSELNLGQESGSVQGKLTSTGVTLGDTTQNANCAWSRVQALELDATAQLAPGERSELTLKGELGQTELSWGDFTTRADIGISAQLEQGLLARDGQGSVHVNLRHAAIQSGDGGNRGWSAIAPELAIAARLTRSEGKLLGTTQVDGLGVKGRIGATHLSSDVHAQFKVDELNPSARTAHGSGAVHLRNVALPNAPEPISKWWADVQVDSLYGHAEQNLELGGTFRAELRDATPGLAVLASQGSLPKWIPSAFPLRGLSVTGSLARRCRLTDIHLVNLSGGPAVARGRLQSVPDGFQGALLLRLSSLRAISVGLDFDSQHTNVGLFDGDAWLARFEQSFDRQSNRAVKLACPPDTNQCIAPDSESRASSDSNELESAEPAQRAAE